MRTVRILTASVLLAGAALVVPVVSVVATPKAVAPDVERVPMPAPHATTGGQLESLLTRSTGGTDVVGVGFPDRSTADEVTVTVRTRLDGRWGSWTALGFTDSAADPGTSEAARARSATEPVAVHGTDAVQVRVRALRPSARLDRVTATFVDGGTSAADASVGRTPPAAARAATARPTVVSRAAWGADESLRRCSPSYASGIKGAVVHHTVNSNTYTADAVPAMLRGIYAYHVNANGWCDVGYNFLVDRFGRLFEGRFGGVDRNVIGAHTQGFNAQTVGVASLGNHAPESSGAVTPSAGALTAVGALIAWKASLNGWDPGTSVSYSSAGSSKWPAGSVVTTPRVSAHRDFNLTTCPGDLMVGRLATVRSTATAVFTGADAAAEVPPSTLLETYTRPAGTSFTVSGRGFGHGLGMSQYGAHGAALKGLTRDQILAFYYPGTTRSTSVGNPTIRVRLTALGSSSTQVVAQPGLVISDGTRTGFLHTRNADGSLRQRWRLVPDGTGLTLQWLENGSWRSTSSWKAVTTPLSFTDSALGKVRVVLPDSTQRDYRRTIRTIRAGSGVMTLSIVPMSYYLQSVVPSEMVPSWPTAALQAQAVAARTFAAYQKAHQPSGTPYDTCDSTACQVYKGLAGYTSSGTVVPYENAATTAAVSATNGLGLLYGGTVALTQFSASNGGQTVGSSLPYQVSKADPYDAVPPGSPSSWTRTLSVGAIEKAYPTTGTLRALRIDKRDGIRAWGGRITSLTVIGSAGSKTVTGDAFRTALGLRSRWWTVTSAPAVSATSFPKDLDGNRTADLLAVDPGGQLRLLAGNGAQGFTPGLIASGWGRVGLVANVGSWDGDNRHDVVERDAGTLYYHPGNGRGGLFPRVAISSGWEGVDWVGGGGDVDGDGLTDLLARNAVAGQLKIYRGNGKGGVLGTTVLGSGWNGFRLVVAPGDLTGDGRADVLGVRASDAVMRLYPGTGSGALGTPVTVAGSWAGYSALMGPGDVTGDGRDDLVGRRASDGAIVVFAGNDQGQLSASTVVPGTSTWSTWTSWTP